LLDTGHARFAGVNPLDLAHDYAGRITHVHCKDVRADVLRAVRERNASFLDAVVDGVFTVPGDGSVDFPVLLAALKQGGYSGWLVVEAEQDPAKADPETYAGMGHDNLARMAAEAGFTRRTA
jgi:inosose dehydratase